MKTNVPQISTILLLAISPLALATPTGFIESSSTFVRADTPVDLNWKINLPSVVEDLVNFDSPKKQIKAKENVLAETRVLGAAIGPSYSPLYATAHVRAGNSGWDTLFSGFADGLGAASTNTFYLTEGQNLDFLFRTWYNSYPGISQALWGALLPPVRTGTSDPRLIILKNGDEAPSYNGLYDQAATTAFVGPYLAEDGKTIVIPENSLIIFAELDVSVDSSSDFQDVVVLVNFTKAP